MGLLKHLRSRSRLEPNEPQGLTAYPQRSPPAPYRGRDQTQRLPEQVLEIIFAYVCPHSQDHSYEPSERSQIGDGCMLCDMRDLARCAQVCRKWYGVAQRLLYASVRIDAVHYCALEEQLAEKRKKGKHFRTKSAVIEPGEVPAVRLSLLCRTVREQDALAQQVLILKIPYMTRETAKGELARCVSALPNLRYVDLPDGFFTGDPSCLALRQELQARCPDIRKMSYRSGSEEALELLAHKHWQSIETLELSGLAIEPATLRIVLASLPTLHDLTLRDLPWLDDSIFQTSQGRLPDFPPLQLLRLEGCTSVTAQGLCYYLDAPRNRELLASLSLQSTGVTVQDLHVLLWKASQLQHLSVSEVVSKSLAIATAQLPPLTSISLRVLHFEITSSEDVHGLQKPAETYYAYLATSLHLNALPGLTTLFVRDPHFTELLILPPVAAPFAATVGSDSGSLRSKPSNLSGASSSRIHNTSSAGNAAAYGTGGGLGPPNLGAGALSRGGFNQTLEVFSKGLDELEWVFTSISPPSKTINGRDRAISSSTGGRPLSAYSAALGLGPQWAQGGFGGDARKSVIVGNGFGGFLAVPQEEVPRPPTSDGSHQIDGAGGTRWGSIGSQATAGSQGSRGSFLKPPPSISSFAGSTVSVASDRRESKHDLWR
ncbi:hypothetical protein BAUCODRAFT_36766 [Baudoinia panamericana UAMH 10762]|uniref:F-box domain-containing protein n=1 Tax=Baudoinia panamericana (strain UAMH 10762) TaxID=717646 RepID=M2N5H1_BAUPA|nr:uncharacterized protein BAUCODRAFT_36766 [Baudoinia panamericana UAMH 10762]EMC94294.1 hypothetical protein BAUCODRAFT_36766 [Baudoinia panamericana UAMH 10762]